MQMQSQGQSIFNDLMILSTEYEHILSGSSSFNDEEIWAILLMTIGPNLTKI